MKERIAQLMLQIAEEQNPTLPRRIETAKGLETALFGPGAPLDSLGLVSFIVELEARLEDEFGVSVALASERAMSQRSSPFLTVGSLAIFAETILQEAGARPTGADHG